MMALPSVDSIRLLLKYNDWANEAVLKAAARLSEAQLDSPHAIGMGTLRRTIKHIFDGEHVWLQRWQGYTDTPWPPLEERVDLPTLTERFRKSWHDRDLFLSTVEDSALAGPLVYRDSKGSLFTATLGQMMIQLIVHSTHHRAQVVNMIRRSGGGLIELDYMTWVRKPA